MKKLISQALIAFGYRSSKANIDVFMKPIGYSILIAEFVPNYKDGITLELRLAFNNANNGKLNFWNKSEISYESDNVPALEVKMGMKKEALFEKICEDIAHMESYIGLEHASINHKCKTFAFSCPADIAQIAIL